MKNQVVLIIVLALSILGQANSALAASASQSGQFDDQFCNQTNIKEVAAKLTRDWGERYRQSLVEKAADPSVTIYGTVVQSSKSEVTCRFSFRGVIPNQIPVRRLELRNVDFLYSKPKGQPQLTAITLPMTGIDWRGGVLAIWERLLVDGETFRSILEAKAENDPKTAVAVAEIIGRPKGTEGLPWEPDAYCAMLNATNVPPAITSWAEESKAAKDTGLVSVETPRWLPATDWMVANLKVVSSIPFQSVICSASVSYTANMFEGKRIPMEIRGLSYKIWGNDDGSQMYVETHRWPNATQQKDAENIFSRSWVVNGETFQQAWDKNKQAAQVSGAPRNVFEALGQKQSQANAEVENYLKKEGVDVDALKHAEAEQTEKYAEPCRLNGGTWGRQKDKYGNQGRLGCYYPTRQ